MPIVPSKQSRPAAADLQGARAGSVRARGGRVRVAAGAGEARRRWRPGRRTCGSTHISSFQWFVAVQCFWVLQYSRTEKSCTILNLSSTQQHATARSWTTGKKHYSTRRTEVDSASGTLISSIQKRPQPFPARKQRALKTRKLILRLRRTPKRRKVGLSYDVGAKGPKSRAKIRSYWFWTVLEK